MGGYLQEDCPRHEAQAESDTACEWFRGTVYYDESLGYYTHDENENPTGKTESDYLLSDEFIADARAWYRVHHEERDDY